MKLLILSLIFTGLGVYVFAADEKAAEPLAIQIVQLSPQGVAKVELINTSKAPIKLFRESNSWGAARWRLLTVREGKLKVYSERLTQIFTRNIPTFDELPPGAHLTKEVDFNGEPWRETSERRISFDPGDMVIIIYDVPMTSEARNLGVWYGVIASLRTVD